MKRIITATFVLSSLLCFSQSNVVAGGTDATGSGGSVNLTIGQIDYNNTVSSSGSVHQGVQQPFEFYEISSGLKENELLTVNLYPNPTSDFIVLNIATSLDELSYHLIDAAGKLVASGSVISEETRIETKDYARGQYHLTLLSESSMLKTYKIIKN